MTRAKSLILVAAIVAVSMLSVSSEAQAGPLLDWLRGLRRPANAAGCCGTQAPNYRTPNYQVAPQQAAYAPNAYGLQPGQCMQTCQKECSRTVVSYTPYTAYRTNWNRVPVTQYKPVTNSDPCTGCTVTCMKPCTTYTYQMQRVPYTTYRPTYRTETYKVPVTTITNNCATGNCGTGIAGCNTCGVNTIPNQAPVMAAPLSYQPAQVQNQGYPIAPGSAVERFYESPLNTTGGSYGTSVLPADQAPALSSPLNGVSPTTSYRPVLDRLRNGVRNMTTSNQTDYQNTTPVVRYPEQTAQSTIRKEWNYSPVRLASYSSDIQKPTQRAKPRMESTYRPIQRPAPKSNNLNGWEVVK